MTCSQIQFGSLHSISSQIVCTTVNTFFKNMVLKNNPQLDTTDEGPEQSHHAQELDPAQVLHRVLLAQVGHSVENSTEQDQAVAQYDISGCRKEKSWA